jgi:cytochrome c7-like protein
MSRWGRAVSLSVLLAAAGVTPARAQQLASPGPLTTAHARFDDLTKCLLCHEAGRELSGRRCLGCHASLAARVRAGQGYHAQATRQGATLACATCHSEHNGRPYRLVRWPSNRPKEEFDHSLTGFTLEGAHARTACDDCHRAALVADAAVRADSSLSLSHTYLGLGRTCGACHLDEHRGRTNGRCQDCHTMTAWKPARFDHDSTRFGLTGRHRDLACNACHSERRQVVTGPGGDRDTSFVDFRTARTGTAGCTGCHNSPHRNAARFARCEACHSTAGWFALPDSLRRFDHSGTGFPLRGAHAAARCESCHLTSADAPLPPRVALVRANFTQRLSGREMRHQRCDDCHVTVHAGELAGGRDCDVCHDEADFTPARYPTSMHDSTAFPLSGAHAAVPCRSCHGLLSGAAPGSGRIGFRHADMRCATCHTDPHGGQFADRTCDGCHTVIAWDQVTFDHNATRYPLRGAHLRLTCSRCHTPEPGRPRGPIRFRGLPLTCAATGCHTDPHGGQFVGRTGGDACTVCHSDERWKPSIFDHLNDSNWPLDGAHRNVRCNLCHQPQGQPPVVRYRGTPMRCEDCHR